MNQATTPDMEIDFAMPDSMRPIVDRVAAEVVETWDIGTECVDNIICEFLFQASREIRAGRRIELEYIGTFELMPHIKKAPWVIYGQNPDLSRPLIAPEETT